MNDKAGQGKRRPVVALMINWQSFMKKHAMIFLLYITIPSFLVGCTGSGGTESFTAPFLGVDAIKDQSVGLFIDNAININLEEESLVRNARAFDEIFSSKVNFVRNDHYDRFFEKITRQILSSTDLSIADISIRIFDHETPIAFTPGHRYVYISTGLLSRTYSKSQIAFIVSHEISHIINQDRLEKPIVNSLYSLGGSIGLASNSFGSLIAGIVSNASEDLLIPASIKERVVSESTKISEDGTVVTEKVTVKDIAYIDSINEPAVVIPATILGSIGSAISKNMAQRFYREHLKREMAADDMGMWLAHSAGFSAALMPSALSDFSEHSNLCPNEVNNIANTVQEHLCKRKNAMNEALNGNVSPKRRDEFEPASMFFSLRKEFFCKKVRDFEFQDAINVNNKMPVNYQLSYDQMRRIWGRCKPGKR